MGLGEFLRQWPGRRIVVGVALSVLLHALLVAAGLWGLVPGLAPQWKTKPGDSLIVELPRPDEPVGAGVPSPAPPAPAPVPRTPAPPASAPARATPQPARVEPRPAPPAPAREKAAPPREERRVAAAARPTPPAPPAPRAPETPTSLPEPAPRAAEPPQASEPAPRAAEPAPRASEPVPPAPEAAPRGLTPAEPRGESGERQVASVPPSGTGRPSLSDVRAALRSGSGGLGQGRGGIEGDPIPLDSPDGRYSDYLEQVKRKIMEKWGYPCVKNPRTRECEPHTTSLDVHFGILEDGRIQFVDIVRFSDHVVYDEYAVNAIKLASPYPPVPPVMMRAMKAGSAGLALRARFSYVQEASLTKFLR